MKEHTPSLLDCTSYVDFHSSRSHRVQLNYAQKGKIGESFGICYEDYDWVAEHE